MNPSALRRKAVVSFCLIALVALSFRLAAGDSGQPPAPAPTPNPPLTRPLNIQGEFDTAIQILPPFPSFPPEPFQPILHMLITANGNLLPFGRTTAATTGQAVDLSVIPNRGTGYWVFQTAKGDALWTETDLTSTPLDPEGRTTFGGNLTVTGGTGELQGATGTLQFKGTAQGAGGFFTVAGTLYVTSPGGQ